MGTTRPARRILSLFPIAGLVLSLGAASVLLGVCGPFTDVTDATFCPFVLEIFTLGITTGTSPTTYDPSSPVSRLQMAAFLSRSVDGVLRRGSRRVAVSQNFSPQNAAFLGVTTVGSSPAFVRTDGADLWVTNSTSFLAFARATASFSTRGPAPPPPAEFSSPWDRFSRAPARTPASSTRSTPGRPPER